MGHILVKKYPQLTEGGSISISLDDILNWPYWPDFIKLYSMLLEFKGAHTLQCNGMSLNTSHNFLTADVITTKYKQKRDPIGAKLHNSVNSGCGYNGTGYVAEASL